jgi:hypothetical protein
MAELAKEDGIKDSPVPIIRWVTPEQANQAYGDCMKSQGLDVVIDPSDGPLGSVDVKSVPGQEAAQNHADWVCESEYPTMPDRDHGKTSEKTKRVYFDYYVNELLPCLAKQGYSIRDVPSFQVFADEYNTSKNWNPYATLLKQYPSSGPSVGALQALCPQRPNDGRLDYLYDTSSPGD